MTKPINQSTMNGFFFLVQLRHPMSDHEIKVNGFMVSECRFLTHKKIKSEPFFLLSFF